MRITHCITCLWPGLPALWWRASLSGLAAAVGFAGLLNLALMLSVGPLASLPAANLAEMAAWSAVIGWVVWCFVRTVGTPAGADASGAAQRLPDSGVSTASSADAGRESAKAEFSVQAMRFFQQAQSEYLRGHWFEAEELLGRVLELSGGEDPDAMLFLAGIYRRTERFSEAKGQLRRLEHPSFKGKWGLEIELERRRLAESARSEGEPEALRVEPEPPAKGSAEVSVGDDLPDKRADAERPAAAGKVEKPWRQSAA